MDSGQWVIKGMWPKVLWVLLAVLAFMLLGAITSQTARADLLGPASDLIDSTAEAVENAAAVGSEAVAELTEAASVAPLVEEIVEIVPPLVEDVVEVIPPLVEEVVVIVPPLVEDVVEVIPPLVEEVVVIVPPLVEDVVEVIPPLDEIIPPLVGDPGAIELPVIAPQAPPANIPIPISGGTSVAEPASPAVSGVLFDESVFGLPSPTGGAYSTIGAPTEDREAGASAASQRAMSLRPYVPIAGLVPASANGSDPSGPNSPSRSWGGLFDGGMQPFGFFAVLAALLALCLIGLIRDRSRSGRSIFPRHEARPG